MNIYLDTSVLIPIYVPESRTDPIISFLKNVSTKIYVSRLAETEFHSTISIKLRTKELLSKQVSQLMTAFNEDIQNFIYERIYISDETFKTAIEFLSAHKTNLRTLDALHLACASLVNANLITADQELAKAANYFRIPCSLL